MMCDTYQAVTKSPTEPYDGPNEAGNVTANEVGWLIPTRDAKTFHPRTLGHDAYVRAIENAMQNNGGGSEPAPIPVDGGGIGRKLYIEAIFS
jgi:hypothetical protein